jgi:ABC-2 type transport system ATP-binding protein
MWVELEAMARVERMTVLLTTHYLDEADRLASRLAIVDHGRVVAEGTPEELKNGLRGDAVFVELAPDTDVARSLSAISRVSGLNDVLADGRTLRARADIGSVALPQLLAALDEARLKVASATVARPSLDDVYLRHTGHSIATSKENAL